MVALLVLSHALAQDPGPTAGLAGGMLLTPDDNPLQGGLHGTVRLGATIASPFDLEVEVSRLEGTTRDFGIGYWSAAARLNALFHVTPDKRADVFFLFGGGMQYVDVRRDSAADAPGADDRALYVNPSRDTVLTAGPGLTLHVVGPLHLRADARWYGTFGPDATVATPDTFSDLEWTLGFDFRAEDPPDKDKDGIPNRYDRCKFDPEDKDGFEDDDGCPDGDNDGDGVMDGMDRCEDEPEDKDGYKDRDGCPDPDNDADGLRDTIDDCPDEAEDRDDFEDRDGCPEPDNDQDGLLDARDKCPDEAEDKDGYADKDGCPDPDNDGDGFADVDDTCHDEPETVNGFQDADGCPDDIPKEVKRFTGVIAGITFETNRDVIRPTSEFTLQDALSVLEGYPDVRLEVSGHTDDVGDDAFNLDLSQRRADAVVRWFTDHGIATSRLRGVGFGETRPLADNGTDAGRAENRRVEFRLLQEETAPVLEDEDGSIEIPSTPMDLEEEPTRSPDRPDRDVEPGEDDVRTPAPAPANDDDWNKPSDDGPF